MRSHHPSKRSEVVQKEASINETPQGEVDETKKSVKESSKHEERVEKTPSHSRSIRGSSKKDPSAKPSNAEKSGYPSLNDASMSREYDVKINAVNSFHESKIEPQSSHE